MNWYYANAGQRSGPVSQTQFEALVQSGEIHAKTLVWNEGMSNWQEYGQLGASAATGSASPAPASVAPAEGGSVSAPVGDGAVCGECGKTFPESEIIRYGTVPVCNGCRPVFLDRLRQRIGPAGATAQTAGGGDSIESLVAGDYQVSVGESFSASLELLKAKPGLLIGGSALCFLAMAVINVIPILSIVLSLLLTGPIIGAYWLLFIETYRGVGDGIPSAIRGSRDRFSQLIFANLVPQLLASVFAIPLVLVAALLAMTQQRGQEPAVGLIVLMVVLGLICMAGVTYFTVSWIFTAPLVADKRQRFWPAMGLSRKIVGKHFWGTLLMAIVGAFLGFIGFLFCGVGILVTGPIAMGMFAHHYLKVFGGLAEEP